MPAPLAVLGHRLVGAAGVLTTPVLPEAYLQLVDPLFSVTETRARVVAVEREAAGAATLVLRPNARWTRHVAGQWVSLGVEVDGVRVWRSFSVSSAPERRDGLLTVTVKEVPDGRVTPFLVRSLRPGAVVRIGPAQGDFVLPDPLPERLLLVTAGSGITPVLAMLRSLVLRDVLPDTVLVHSAPSADDVVAGHELRALAEAQPRLTLVERHTRTDGRLEPGDVAALVPDWQQREAFVCGPTALLDAAEAHWEAAGAGDRLHVERFRTATLQDVGEGGTVEFLRAGVAAETTGSTTLLEAGEQAGALLPSGCRMGICHTCVGELRSGAVRDLRTGEVRDEPGDQVQTCVSAPAGACVVDL